MSSSQGRGSAFSPSPAPGTDFKKEAMNCKSDPKDYTIVKIHTAKCVICDRRNMATMRRCPGCTYQLCEPCFDARPAGAPLFHGNCKPEHDKMPEVTIVRKKLNNRGDNPPPSGARSVTTGSGLRAAVGGGIGGRNLGGSSAQGTNGNSGVQDLTATSSMGVKRRPRVQRKPSNKSKSPMEDTETDVIDDDSDYLSPSAHSKRAKNDTPVVEATIARYSQSRPPRASARNQSTTTMPQARDKDSGFVTTSEDLANRASSRLEDHNEDDREESYDNASVVEGNVGDPEIEALLNKAGVYSNKYQSHFLGRHYPIVQDPVIGSPRPERGQSAVEKQQQRALGYLHRETSASEPADNAVGAGASEAPEAGSRMAVYIDVHLEQLEQSIEGDPLKPYQKNILLEEVAEGVIELLNQIHKAYPDMIRKSLLSKFDLDTNINYFSVSEKVQIDEVIKGRALKVLKDCGKQVKELPNLPQVLSSTQASSSTSGTTLPSFHTMTSGIPPTGHFVNLPPRLGLGPSPLSLRSAVDAKHPDSPDPREKGFDKEGDEHS